MRGKIINRLSLKNSNEYIKRKSAEIRELTEKLDEIIIESFYIEVMNIKEEKKQIVERFYNKINFLISISSILFSGNLLLFTFIYQEKVLNFYDYKIIVFLASTCLIFISLVGLLFSLSFKSIFHSMNGQRILFEAGKLKSNNILKRMMISTIALSNVLNSAVYEKLKKRMKILFYFLAVAVFFMAISSPLILIMSPDKENKASIAEIPKLNIEKAENNQSKLILDINYLIKVHKELVNTLREVKMADNENGTPVENETVEQQISIPDPASLLNLHTESLDVDSEVRKTSLNENSD